jgi:hypothetical protein
MKSRHHEKSPRLSPLRLCRSKRLSRPYNPGRGSSPNDHLYACSSCHSTSPNAACTEHGAYDLSSHGPARLLRLPRSSRVPHLANRPQEMPLVMTLLRTRLILICVTVSLSCTKRKQTIIARARERYLRVAVPFLTEPHNTRRWKDKALESVWLTGAVCDEALAYLDGECERGTLAEGPYCSSWELPGGETSAEAGE